MSEEQEKILMQQQTNTLMEKVRQDAELEKDKRLQLQQALDIQRQRPANIAAQAGTKIVVRTIAFMATGVTLSLLFGAFRKKTA